MGDPQPIPKGMSLALLLGLGDARMQFRD